MEYDLAFYIEVSLIICCLFSSAFFSAAETAVTSMTKLRIKRMIDDYGEKAILLEKITQKWDNILITLLICNNLANIGAASLATVLMARFFGHDTTMEQVAAVSTGLMTLIILIFGEIVPKTLAKIHAEIFSLAIIGFLDRLSKLLYPFIQCFKFISLILLRLLRTKIEDSHYILTEQEIVAIVEAGEREGVIEEEERDMIRGVIEFGDTYVHEVMVPRVDMVTIESKCSLKDVLVLIKEGLSFSRIPVIRRSADNVVGVLYAKDIMKYVQDPYFEKITVIDIVRKPFFVSENRKLDDLLQAFRQEHVHMGIAIDEYGGTAGLVTIEDLLEEIVGEIIDEHDGEEKLIRLITERVALVDPKINIAEFNEELDLHIPENKDYDSLGGFLTYLAEGFPEKGDSLSYGNMEFQILEADEKRLYRVKVDIKKEQRNETISD